MRKIGCLGLLVALLFLAAPAAAQNYGLMSVLNCATDVLNTSAGQFCLDRTLGFVYGYAGSTLSLLAAPRPALNQRIRSTIAEINAGKTLLPAIAGLKYRLIDATAIAYGGGTCGTVTTVDILATQSSGVKLVALAQASLVQSAVLRAGGTGAAVLADGASFVPNDAGTAITIGKTGSSVDTCTGVDVILTYALEK